MILFFGGRLINNFINLDLSIIDENEMIKTVLK